MKLVPCLPSLHPPSWVFSYLSVGLQGTSSSAQPDPVGTPQGFLPGHFSPLSAFCSLDNQPAATASIIISLLTTSHLHVGPNPGPQLPTQHLHSMSQRHFKLHLAKVELRLFMAPSPPSPPPSAPIPVLSRLPFFRESRCLPGCRETSQFILMLPLPCPPFQHIFMTILLPDNSGIFHHSPPPLPPALPHYILPGCLPVLLTLTCFLAWMHPHPTPLSTGHSHRSH